VHETPGGTVAKADGMILYAGQYADLDDAKVDFEVIKELHKEKLIGRYDAALFTKTEKGKVKIVDTDESFRARGATVGALGGAVLGLIFPPTLLLIGGGAALGAVLGHVTMGMPRSDIKELGEMLDEGEAGIILAGEMTVNEFADRLMKKAKKVSKKEIDVDTEELKKDVDEAAD
jgi:uncharacterized membrane protein